MSSPSFAPDLLMGLLISIEPIMVIEMFKGPFVVSPPIKWTLNSLEDSLREEEKSFNHPL